MSSEAVRDALRSDEDVAAQILNSCLDLGLSDVEAQKLVERALANRRKSTGAAR